MAAPPLHRRWRRRLRAVVESLPGLVRAARRHGAPEAIHELRVTLRRFRLLLGVGRPLLGKKRVAIWRARAARISATAGQVRDLDITMELLDAVPTAGGVRRRRLGRRQRIWAAVREEWRLPRAAWAALAAALPRNAGAAALLKERLRKAETKARATVLHAYPQLADLDARQLHDFRRALRRLRYLRELELSQRRARRDTRLQLLIELQRILGAQQDRVVAKRCLVAENAEVGFAVGCLEQPARCGREWRRRFQKLFLAAARAHRWRLTARPKPRRPVVGRRAGPRLRATDSA